MFSMDWRRPESVTYPQVWHRFEKTTKDGKIVKFKVQDASEEYHDGILELTMKDYIRDEPWNSNTGMADDPKSVEIMNMFFKEFLLPMRVSLVCLLDDESNESKSPIVGFNYLGVSVKDGPEDFSQFIQSEPTKNLLMMFEIFKQHCPNIYEKYNVDAYLGAIGLCVNSDFRGMNISAEILRTRIPLCKAIGLKISNTIFTANASQKTAKKAGFEVDASVSYDELRKVTGFEFKNCVNCEMMTLRIE